MQESPLIELCFVEDVPFWTFEIATSNNPRSHEIKCRVWRALVKEADRVKARRGKVGSGKQDSDVSFARDRPRDQFYVSEIFVEKPNVELLDEENSHPIGIMNG